MRTGAAKTVESARMVHGMKMLQTILVMTVAVFVGSLGAQLAHDYLLAHAAVATLNTVARALTDNVEGNREHTRDRRAASATGQDLLRRCNEFRAAYQDNGGAYALEQLDIACKRHRTFVETGRLIR